MLRFLIRRLCSAVVVVWIVSIVTFLIFQIAPTLSHTSPVYYYTGKTPFPPGSLQLKLLERRYGFDLPILDQYWHWLRAILVGQYVTDGTSAEIHCAAPCLGYSFRLETPVTSLIWQALPVTLSLAVGAALLWLISGVLLGTMSGLRPGTVLDRVGMLLALAPVSLPTFFVGPLLLLVVVFKLKWLPSVNYVGITQDPAQWLRSMILPWITLAMGFSALYARLTRANLMEVMSEDYIRTARAKGLGRPTIVLRHGLRPALTPILTIFGMDVGTLIGSCIIVEQIFNLHGLGHLTIFAIEEQDLPVIMGVTIFAALAVVLANVVVDFLYAVVDPRVGLR